MWLSVYLRLVKCLLHLLQALLAHLLVLCTHCVTLAIDLGECTNVEFSHYHVTHQSHQKTNSEAQCQWMNQQFQCSSHFAAPNACRRVWTPREQCVHTTLTPGLQCQHRVNSSIVLTPEGMEVLTHAQLLADELLTRCCCCTDQGVHTLFTQCSYPTG